MKTIITLIAVFLLPNFGESESNFKSELGEALSSNQGIEISAQQYQEWATHMANISDKYPEEWLAKYYAGYYLVLQGFSNPYAPETDSILDVAEAYVKSANQISPNNSELFCLQSMISSARILVDPQGRGYSHGQMVTRYLQQAMQQNPNNPRIYLLQAQGLLYMPEEYGGGCKAALPALNTAMELYQSFVPETNLHPNWGAEETEDLIKNCN